MYSPRSKENYNGVSHWIWNGFFILLLCLVVFILFESPVFELNNIYVRGCKQLNPKDIETVSGLSLDLNIFKIDITEIQKNVKNMPLVKEVQVKRLFPAAVVIEVVEREAVAVLNVGESFMIVDSEGIFLKEGGVGSVDVPIITGVKTVKPALGQEVRSDELVLALKIIKGLPQEVLKRLSEVHVEPDGKVYIYSLEGIQGRMGSAQDIERKGKMFLQVLDNLKSIGKKVLYVDLSSPGWPAVYFEGEVGFNGSQD